MNFKHSYLYTVIVFLSACASSPSALYSSLSNPDKTVATTNAEVIKKTHATSLPVKIHGFSLGRESYEITADDPIIDFEAFKSNYKLFSFKVDRGDKFRVEVISFCDCLGFDKRILVPIAYIFNESGKEIEQNIVAGGVYGVATASVTIEASASESGQYYLLVGANNSNPGEIVGSEDLMLYGVAYSVIPTGIPIINKSNPYGKIMPSYELVK